MKRIFAFFTAILLFVGCQRDIVDVTPSISSLSSPLMLSIGESSSRVFDDELVWSWEPVDEIVGYQNMGEKTRNTLSQKEDNLFGCENFIYSTAQAAKFHFFYANEVAEGVLTAVQDGTWRPVLVGTTDETTLDAILGVDMEHLSAALEVRVWKGDESNHAARKVTAAKLSSESDFVGKWSVKQDLSYEQTLDCKEIALADLDTSTVVFNMPAGEFDKNTLALTLTHDGVDYNYSLPTLSFVKGKRTIVNIVIRKTATNLPIGSVVNDAIPSDATSVKFVVNSDVTSAKKLVDGNYPIYVVNNGTNVEFHTIAEKYMAASDSRYMFNESVKVASIDMANVDTSKATSMYYMFRGCKALTSLNLDTFINTSKVEDMSFMFEDCSSIESLDLSSFNTSNVESMKSMFEGCSSLSSLDLGSFDTSKVTVMNCMFKGCKSLPLLDLTNFDTSNVKDMDDMFRGCSSLLSVDLSNFNTRKVYYLRDMFNGCSSLQMLNLTSFTFNEGVRVNGMFIGVGRVDSVAKIYASVVGGYEFLLANRNSLGSGYYEILPQRFF